MTDWLHGFRYARPLQRLVTATANFGPYASSQQSPVPPQTFQDIKDYPAQVASVPDLVSELGQFDAGVFVLVIQASSKSASQAYDIYVTGGLQKVRHNSTIGVDQATPLRWDVVHFPQVTSAVSAGTPLIYAARVNGVIFPQTVTDASPGVAANDPACLLISAPSAGQGILTLAAGDVRHGYWGDHLTHELVCSGGGPYSISYEIWLSTAAI